jgi:mono/diheme cytochrome c family protein
MRLKTLGVVFVSVLALFTVVYWLTDKPRLEAATASQEEHVLAYGEEVFGPPTDELPAAANCARCHGPEGEGGAIPGDPSGRQAPNLHSRRIADRLRVNPLYVNLVIRYGGVVVSGDVNSPMPAWSLEAGGPLTEEQIDALTVLVESWAMEAAEEPVAEVENTAEAGQQVYNDMGCGGCHGADLAGSEQFPNIQNIGNEPVVEELPTPVSRSDQISEDYEADPREFLRMWIRDSSGNYNDGSPTGMPPYPEEQLPEDALEALITFLLEQQQ